MFILFIFLLFLLDETKVTLNKTHVVVHIVCVSSCQSTGELSYGYWSVSFLQMKLLHSKLFFLQKKKKKKGLSSFRREWEWNVSWALRRFMKAWKQLRHYLLLTGFFTDPTTLNIMLNIMFLFYKYASSLQGGNGPKWSPKCGQAAACAVSKWCVNVSVKGVGVLGRNMGSFMLRLIILKLYFIK